MITHTLADKTQLAALMLRLKRADGTADQFDLLTLTATETGGSILTPQMCMENTLHRTPITSLFEIDILGIHASGQSAEEAVAAWIRVAKYHLKHWGLAA